MAKILAVDDAKVMRELVKISLTSEGHEVFLAEDGVLALDFARANSVDMVVTDINMPNMSGISLVPKLRRVPGYEQVPILMLTTEDGQYHKEKAKSLGANAWLTKPFDPPRLQNAVSKMLQKAYA